MTPNFEINVILSLKLVTNPFPYVRKFTFAILKNSYWNYASISINYENTELILPLSLLSNPTQVLAQQNPPKIWRRILMGVQSEALMWPMVGLKWPLYDRLGLEPRVANSTQCWKCTKMKHEQILQKYCARFIFVISNLIVWFDQLIRTDSSCVSEFKNMQ